MTGRAAAVVVAIRDALAKLEIHSLAHDERTDIMNGLVVELGRIAGVTQRADPDLADVLEQAWRNKFGKPTPYAEQAIARLRRGED